MNLLSDILALLSKLDKIYDEVIQGNKDLTKVTDLMNQMVICLDKIDFLDDKKRNVSLKAIQSFNSKIELIYDLIDLDYFKPSDLGLDNLRKQMDYLELKRYEIMNKYVLGTLKKEEIDFFEEELGAFRARVYEFVPAEEEIMDIAKMKSKIQHLNTEVLEDEEVLRVAYENSN